MADYRAMAGDAGVAHGLPRDRFIRQIGVESVNYAVNVIECRLDSPAGARGIAQLMPIHWSAVDPCDPHAALDYAARLMRGHWDYWQGQGKDADTAYGLALASYNAGRQATIDGLAGRKAWWPFVETMTYLTRILQVDDGQARAIMTGSSNVPSPLPFKPDARIDLQPDDWSCSIQATEWLLRSIGRNPGDQWIQDNLLNAGIVTREHGLSDASGQQLADWLTREYGAEVGWAAQAAPVDYDDVVAGAGTNPTLIGGRRWGKEGHWAGVRGMADGALWLANSAPDYTNTGPTLDRAEWDARGPWTAVWIDRASTLPATPPPAPAPESWRVQLAQKLREALAIVESAPS